MGYDFTKTCRICKSGNEPLVSIFNPPNVYGRDVPLIERIAIICNLKIKRHDDLPQNICTKCAIAVKRAYNLRKMSLASDRALKLCLLKNETTNPPTQGCSNTGIRVMNEYSSDEENIKAALPPTIRSEKSGIKSNRCPQCGQIFIESCLLIEHMTVAHNDNRRFLCSICGLTFSRLSILRNHHRTHSDDKPFNCDICSQSFRRRANLMDHRRTHTGEKPFVCEHCQRGFAKICYLKDHMRLHSGEKPFVCEHCGRSFARRSCLIMHRRTHTGELPYSCPECSTCFSQRSQRKRHVKTHHKNSKALGENGELFLKEYDKSMAISKTITKDKENDVSVTPISTITYNDYQLCKMEPEYLIDLGRVPATT